MFAGFTSRCTSPRAWRGVECGGDLPENAERPPQRQLPLAHEQRLQVAALHVGHRDVEDPVLLACVEDRNDAGMVERRRQLRLAQEPLAVVSLTERGREELQRGRA